METPSEQIIGLYERHAADWDDDRSHRRPDGEKTWVRRFAGIALLDSFLDLGCGSGTPIAADLIDAGHAITGVDASPSLIGLCRARFPDHEWIVADMRMLDLGRRFGGMVVWHSLFHLSPDAQTQMFPIFARHLLPGAPLMFTSGSQRGESVGQWRGEPLYHASLDAGEYEALLEDNGFRLIEHLDTDPTCGGATIWLATRTDA